MQMLKITALSLFSIFYIFSTPKNQKKIRPADGKKNFFKKLNLESDFLRENIDIDNDKCFILKIRKLSEDTKDGLIFDKLNKK